MQGAIGQTLEIALSSKQRRELQSLVARASESAGVVRRAHVVLWSADGVSGQEVAQRLRLTVEAVSRIRRRFVESGVAGLQTRPKAGRKDHAVPPATVECVDGITKEQYGQDLERNLRDLHAGLEAKRYRHQPILRVHIPKEKGKTRPIGVSAFEDKLVQDALREVLEAIYERDFLACS